MIKAKKVKKAVLTALLMITMVSSMGALSGCSIQGTSGNSGGVEQTEPNDQKTPENAARVVETTLDLVQEKDRLKLDFSLKNTSGKELAIMFGSGHQYDIIVADAKGQVVFDWAMNKSFTQALVEKTLGTDEPLSFSEEWDYTNLRTGNRVPAGQYTVTVKILASSDQKELKAEELTAVKEIQVD